MKRKISLSMCCIAISSVIITAILISFVLYNRNYKNMTNNIQNEVEYMAAAMNTNGIEYLDAVKDVSPSRITWILDDGSVIFDNSGKKMENHSDRPEFREALASGIGESSRLSETLREKTYYYALLMNDGTVLRISNTTSSIFSDIFSSLPYLVLVTCVILIIVVIISHSQTKKIVKPINEINLDSPQTNMTYDELLPLLSRIEKQNHDIHKFIEKLQAKQNEFKTVTQNMSEGLIIINKHNILSCNKSALKIFGNDNLDYTGRSILEFNHSKTFIDAVESTLKGKANEINMPIDNKNYLMIASPVFDDKNVTGAVILLIDTTEKNSREALRREFSANVSHELKTPLTTISGYAEIMKSGWADPKDYQMFAEKIYSEGKRLINLIDDIINLSKLDENSSEMKMEIVDLLHITQDIVATLSEKAAKKHVEIKLSGEDVEINAIPHLLYEMIFNLCDNAIKYNNENGKVTITVVRKNNYSKLIVSDTGIGIALKDTERIFERFYCVDKSHSKETGGTGLGLSIVKHAAILHDAKIDVDSVLGDGTTITLTFKNHISTKF